jgi:predicted PurR-regulated permease PerM
MSESEAIDAVDAGDVGASGRQVVSPFPSGLRRLRVVAELGHPFRWGFVATAGALVAISLGGALASLSSVLVWVGAAIFIALALDPPVRWLERHHVSRGLGIAIVFIAFAVLLGGLLALVIPTAVVQISQFAASAPGYITTLQQAEWFKSLISSTGQSTLYATLLNQAQSWLANPANLLALGGGALSVGTGLVNGITGALMVMVLTLYFLASLRTITDAVVRVAPAHARGQVRDFAERITESVGGYVSGMVVLAIINAIVAFVLLSAVGVPFAALLAVAALGITMIPIVGPTVFWVLACIVAYFTSWWALLIFGVIFFVYIQVQAYVLTPKVMTKAVDIPGSLVLIGALVGATLLGLLGALVAVPVTAALLMIGKEVLLPRQDAKTVDPNSAYDVQAS